MFCRFLRSLFTADTCSDGFFVGLGSVYPHSTAGNTDLTCHCHPLTFPVTTRCENHRDSSQQHWNWWWKGFLLYYYYTNKKQLSSCSSLLVGKYLDLLLLLQSWMGWWWFGIHEFWLQINLCCMIKCFLLSFDSYSNSHLWSTDFIDLPTLCNCYSKSSVSKTNTVC